MPLEPENQKHLEAARGFVELGMFMDANEELENIDPEVRHLPETLAVRLEIYRSLQRWELMQAVAKKLNHWDPDEVQWWISWAYATRRAECIDAAPAHFSPGSHKSSTEGHRPLQSGLLRVPAW